MTRNYPLFPYTTRFLSVDEHDDVGLFVGKDDGFRQEADRFAVVLDISMAVLLADVDTEAVAGILAVREQDRGFLRGPVVGGKEGAIDAGDVPFGEVARGHRQFARGVEPAGRGGLFGAHRAEIGSAHV